jgi:Nuclear pore complex assembly
MLDWTSFDTVFGKGSKWTYDQNAVHTILRNRQNMEGMLFFDRIWGSLGLKQCEEIIAVAGSYRSDCCVATKLFPPKSNHDLRKIFDIIVKSTAPDHQKHAIVYYILRDCKPLTDHGEAFTQKVYLPRKYKLLISGLHDLDQGHAKQALEPLTDPSLTPTFSDQILYTLLQNSKVDISLVMGYYITVSPPLDDQKTLRAYFSFLCDTNLVHAYHFCQTRAGSERESLFEQLVLAALSPKDDQHVLRAEALISLPFTEMEMHWFEDFLLHGKGSSLHGAKDSVVMRRIATGRDFADLPTLQRYWGQKINGVNWGDVRTIFQPNNIT